MDISVIIVNYNVRYFLEQCLRSLLKASDSLKIEIIVVDNQSTDGSVELIREKFSDIYLIANQDNVGFGKACNQGLKVSKGKYVLFLNPDTIIQKDTLNLCFSWMNEHLETGAMGVRMIDGAANFLPESKRGFPSSWASFCKITGLYKVAPKSKFLNTYYLGNLSENEINEVDVLTGAFFFTKRKLLEEIGGFDEDFFMYGEDIDLSWRIKETGHSIIYYPLTNIVHYKGESTKKGSIDQITAFYNAMIIFTRKHFNGRAAAVSRVFINMAIVLSGIIAFLKKSIKSFTLPVLDIALGISGFIAISRLWGYLKFDSLEYYESTFYTLVIPIWFFIWIVFLWLNGAYDSYADFRKIGRGLLVGTIAVLVVYGLFPDEYRYSRAMILLGAAWLLLSIWTIRQFVFLLQNGKFLWQRNTTRNILVAGKEGEYKRTQDILNMARFPAKIFGPISPSSDYDSGTYMTDVANLPDLIDMHSIDEVIFSQKDFETEEIIRWMSELQKKVAIKILPEQSNSIIGSKSKDKPGELYTLEVNFKVALKTNLRFKRIADISIALLSMLMVPLTIIGKKNLSTILKSIPSVIIGKKTWIGYEKEDSKLSDLPNLPLAVFPHSYFHNTKLGEDVHYLNTVYARDYNLEDDLRLFIKILRDK